MEANSSRISFFGAKKRLVLADSSRKRPQIAKRPQTPFCQASPSAPTGVTGFLVAVLSSQKSVLEKVRGGLLQRQTGAGRCCFGEKLTNEAEIGKKLAGPLYVCRSARFCWCGQICRSCGVEREILEKRSAENALTTPDQNRRVVFFGRLRIARQPGR